jgi:hypothetical protein
MSGLRIVFPEDADRHRALEEALQAARRPDLPADPEELLRFVETYLAPRLAASIHPQFVRSLLDDLAVELRRGNTGSEPVSAPSGRPRTGPASPTGGNPKEPVQIRSNTPFPKLKRSVENLVRTSRSTWRGGSSPMPSKELDGAAEVDRAQSVFLVHADRAARAALARVLVAEGFDVSSFDSAFEVVHALRSREGVVAVVDVDGDVAQSRLRAIVDANPSVRILAVSLAPTTVTENVRAHLGGRRFSVVSKSASPPDFVEGIRKLVGGSGSGPHGTAPERTRP